MNRLQAELQRLYSPQPSQGSEMAEGVAQPLTLIEPPNQVRAMVMEVTRPPSWETLARVWHGVQAELDLPAPAIAVSGTDGLQLWFSLAEPIAASRAHAFLVALQSRFLPEIDAGRLRLMPAADASALQAGRHARPVPALQQPSGNWSAFVAQDLAPVFDDAPWLDIPPNEEGQAALLRGLQPMAPAAFDAALRGLVPEPPRRVAAAALAEAEAEARAHAGAEAADAAAPIPRQDAVRRSTTTPAASSTADSPKTSTEAASEDARRFLLHVMNDPAVALPLRIEAAKALLQQPGAREGG